MRMDFGMISYNELSEETFLLPRVEQPFLSGNKTMQPRIYIGLSKWTYKEHLKKKNNPPPQPGTLPFYAHHFNAVELNATHYEIPDAEKINKWYRSVEQSNFQFCPKFYKGITHIGPIGLSKMGLTNDFIKRMKGLHEKLGPSFIQLNETITPDKKETLIDYLRNLPNDFEVSIEIRNAEWINDSDKWRTFVKQLNNINKGLVITDTPGKRDLVHMQLSNATAFIRFNCLGDHELDLFRIDQWKKQLKSWYLQGLEKCYFFLHIHNEAAEEDFINYVHYELKF